MRGGDVHGRMRRCEGHKGLHGSGVRVRSIGCSRSGSGRGVGRRIEVKVLLVIGVPLGRRRVGVGGEVFVGHFMGTRLGRTRRDVHGAQGIERGRRRRGRGRNSLLGAQETRYEVISGFCEGHRSRRRRARVSSGIASSGRHAVVVFMHREPLGTRRYDYGKVFATASLHERSQFH